VGSGHRGEKKKGNMVGEKRERVESQFIKMGKKETWHRTGCKECQLGLKGVHEYPGRGGAGAVLGGSGREKRGVCRGGGGPGDRVQGVGKGGGM